MKKNIIITGITKGIGKAIAQKFHENGFHLIGCSSNILNIQNFLKEFPDADIHQVNLAHKSEVMEWGDYILNHYSELEILINNAGKFIPGQIHNEEEGVFEHLLNVNLHSAYHLTRTLLPKFMEQKKGSLFNICSTASIKPYINGGSYCISKFALLGFTKLLREELKPYNIRVTGVLPGATLTDSWAGVDLPNHRFIQSQDLAELIYTIYQLPQTTVVEDLLIRPLLGDIE